MSTTQKELEAVVEQSATYFQEMFLDWVNNFLTLERFAEYYEMTTDKAESTINIGRKIHEQRTKK